MSGSQKTGGNCPGLKKRWGGGKLSGYSKTNGLGTVLGRNVRIPNTLDFSLYITSPFTVFLNCMYL